jgi:hypothetical protein
MLNAILGLFSSFNPMIVGLILSAGAYIFLRNRVVALQPRLVALAQALPRPAIRRASSILD